MIEITLGVGAFTVIVGLLGLFVLAARRLLVPSGECQLRVNERVSLTAQVGQRLLSVLAGGGIYLPSACGGAGTCGLCKARLVHSGNASPSPQEKALLTRTQVVHGVRLACQVSVLGPMSVEVDESCFGVRKWFATVESSRNVSTLIREIVFRLEPGEEMQFRAGGFVQITAPALDVHFKDLDVGSQYEETWSKTGLRELEVHSKAPVTRAYSMANHPGEKGVITLNVRIALPPPGEKSIAPGVVSSWLFSLRPGDEVELEGPYGDFAVEQGDKELVFIGGGAGMAPLRAQILDLLDTQQSTRKMSFWYGGRSARELFYQETFDRLQAAHDNFDWHVALSEPQADDDWQGSVGFIHSVVAEQFLAAHRAPEECEYYLCGPPLMVKAVLATLDDFGVEASAIHYDDFGG